MAEKGRIRQRRVQGHGGILGILNQGFNSFMFLLLVWSLRASNHWLYIFWQRFFIAEVVVAEPTFLSGHEVSSNCFDGCLVHHPWVAWVH
jgi:hypothetical protein